jgi:hypothetical protein
MTMRKILSVVIVAAMFAAACGKSEQQKQAEKAAEDIKNAAEAMSKAAEKQGTAAAAQGSADMAKAMQGMAAAFGAKTADGKPVETLTFQVLETALPSVSGWEMGKPRGERTTAPFPFSKTETSYKNGEQTVRVGITDAAGAAMLLMPVRMMVATGYSKETSDGYEKATTVSGQPAVEKWQPEGKDGELTILANDRFVVEVRGRDIDGVKTLHDFASKIDFGKLK